MSRTFARAAHLDQRPGANMRALPGARRECCSSTNASAARPPIGVVERLGLLEVAHVTGAWDDDELRVRDRLLELACDVER
jgi:hypothetical protein